MKKSRKNQPVADKVIKNPVAKYAHQFNKAVCFTDKTKYRRTAKHKGKEPFTLSFLKGIVTGFLLSVRPTLVCR